MPIFCFFTLLLRIAGALTPSLYIEIGETYNLRSNLKRVWVEDHKILGIEKNRNSLSLKGRQTGLSHLRLDQKLYRVHVLPLEARDQLHDWQSTLAREFSKLDTHFCDEVLCVKGQLESVAQYLQILSLMKKKNSHPLFSVMVPARLELSLQNQISQQLRKLGQTPRKIVFSEPWTVYLPLRHSPPETLKAYQQLGIEVAQQRNSVDIGDNIKVAVKFVEVSRNFERKIGIKWPESGDAQMSLLPTKLLTPDFLDISLRAAEKSGQARILASPNILCRSGKEAHFFAGGEFPIQVIGLHSKEIIWKKYGISLKLEPLIDPLGELSLGLESEVSTLDRSLTADDTPALHSNKVSSHFDLIRSQTIALSGLLKNESGSNSEGIPLLKDIPILGALFSSRNFQQNLSELIVFVTPELVQN